MKYYKQKDQATLNKVFFAKYCVYQKSNSLEFLYYFCHHNPYNAASLFARNKYYLYDGVYYGNQYKFKNKYEWRKFVKLLVFI